MDALLDVHWRQWTVLGLASHASHEDRWTVDLEALTLSTLAIGLHDKRLLSSAVEWTARNGVWINASRLKRIANVFTEPSRLSRGPVLDPGAFRLFTCARTKAGAEIPNIVSPGLSAETPLEDYRVFFEGFKGRGMVAEPRLHSPALLQLLLRALFGVDARAEVLLFLLSNESGNSNQIAKEVYFDQKNVYRILERWTKAGVTAKASDRRAGNYSLNQRVEWLRLLRLGGTPSWANWGRSFLLLDSVARVLSLPPWSDDEYLISSFFRDIANDMKPLARSLEIAIPEPLSTTGSDYFSPFASSVMAILDRLKG